MKCVEAVGQGSSLRAQSLILFSDLKYMVGSC